MYIYMYTVYNTYKIYIMCVYVPYFLLDIIFAPRASASGPVSVPRSWVWSCSGAFGSSSGPAVWAWPCDVGRQMPPGDVGDGRSSWNTLVYCRFVLFILIGSSWLWLLLLMSIDIKWYFICCLCCVHISIIHHYHS